jgi:hypothetical protein
MRAVVCSVVFEVQNIPMLRSVLAILAPYSPEKKAADFGTGCICDKPTLLSTNN